MMNWLAVVLIVFVAFAMVWLVPLWQIGRIGTGGAYSKDRFDSENEARKTLVQLVSGLTFLATLYAVSSNVESTRRSTVTERFTRVVEQLGAVTPSDGPNRNIPNRETRLGAIYALEQIAQSDGEYYVPVVAMLAAYVHANFRFNGGSDPAVEMLQQGNERRVTIRVAPDKQAALTVIARRKARLDDVIDLNVTDLRHIGLVGAQLRRASFEHTQLDRAVPCGAGSSRV